jgi:hypothetical protein
VKGFLRLMVGIVPAVQSQLATRDNAGYWTAVAPEVETLSSRVARQIDSTSTIVANSIVIGSDWAGDQAQRVVVEAERAGLAA